MKDVLIDDLSVARFQRPPGALPSSMLGYEALTGSLDDFGFEDYLNCKDCCPLISPESYCLLFTFLCNYLGTNFCLFIIFMFMFFIGVRECHQSSIYLHMNSCLFTFNRAKLCSCFSRT